jgi:hypothetical protein
MAEVLRALMPLARKAGKAFMLPGHETGQIENLGLAIFRLILF